MFFILIAKAIFLGVIIAAPVGPVGALVIRRTLKIGMALGLATGVGAALADATYATVAIFGVAQIKVFLMRNDVIIAFIGGALLLTLGIFSMIKDWRKRQEAKAIFDELSKEELEAERLSLKAQYGSVKHFLKAGGGAFAITLSNPATVVGFAAAFAAFHLLPEGEVSWLTHGVVILGVLLGALAWWFILASFIRWMRDRLSNSSIFNIQLFTHGLIILSGFLCLLRGLLKVA